VTAHLGWEAENWCETDLTEVWQESAAKKVNSNTMALSLNPFEIKTILIR
jgi:hypothetical protein